MSKNKRILVVFMVVLLCLSHVTVFAAESANVAAVKTYNDAGTHTLTLDGDIQANGCDGAIYVDNASELTINGTGTVHGLVCGGEKCQDETCGYSMAVYANNGSTITIDGGTYTHGSDGTNHSDLIYAARDSKIVINGGTFQSVTPQWTLNCKDNSNSTITVKGGRFYKFDPSNTTVSPAGQNEIVVPEGYIVVQDGDWYEVQKLNDCKEYNGVTETLTLSGDFKANGCDGAIYAHDNANLTINGNGTVYGQVCPDDGYSMAVYANNSTTITINGGTYTHGSDGSDHSDLIYAARDSKIVINGGTFQSVTPQWTLNCKDNSNSTITVKGGRFYKFDPSNTKVSPAGQNEIIVPAEYKVVQDGDWYEVVCAHLNCTEVAEVAATYTETGTKAHWVCDLCEKVFVDEAATTEAVDLVIPKLAEVVDNNATVTPEAFDKALTEAGEDTTVVLPVLETEEVVNSVTVPVDSLETLVDEDKELLIETSEVTLTLDNATLTEIVAQAGNVEDVTIEVVKVEEEVLTETQKEAIKDKDVAVVLSAQILVDGKNVSDFNGGKVTVEVPFVPAENVKITEYKVVYIADDGKVEEVPFEYVDGNIVLELEHFSEYAIVKDAVNSVEGEKDESPKTGSKSIVVCVIMISLVGLAVTKKRK